MSIRQYVLEAVEERLDEDLGAEADGMLTLSTKADPVLGALWGNPRDAAYDEL